MPSTRKKRKRKRALVALAVLALACALAATDLRGRAEVKSTARVLARVQGQLRQTGARLNATDAQLNSTSSGVRATAGKVPPAQSILTGTNGSISSTEAGIFYAGFNISQLNTCLGGVSQALDQVAVGQIQGAVRSLSWVSSSCQAASG